MCRAKCFEWLHVSCSRLELPIPDRNRYVPDRYVPFPISRNIGSVFPSAFPVPVSVPGKKNRNMNGLGVFPTVPDRFQPYTRPRPHPAPIPNPPDTSEAVGEEESARAVGEEESARSGRRIRNRLLRLSVL